MNNLLRTLTESRVYSSFPDTDLKLLLTTVKESRRQSHDVKLSDPFYDSLEGLLHDLRTVTMDNRDPEAFLKPVSKADVPDYYDVITNPMDLQTMLKKVKQKQYKSKREFKDDLDLIWSNCYTYNATENHPLRMCAKRLQFKAEKLLRNITDRKERADPFIPSDMASTSRPKVNGFLNGHTHHRPPSIPTKLGPTVKHSAPVLTRKNRRDIPFPETPAIIRTPSGMATFLQLDRELEQEAPPANNGSSSEETHSASLFHRLREFSLLDEVAGGFDDAGPPDDVTNIAGGIGEKRKLNGTTDHRPRKRARFIPQHSYDESEIVDLWWNAVQSDTLIGNGLPDIAFASSSHPIPNPNGETSRPPRRRRAKKPPPDAKSKSLLQMMNNNIRTMRRTRRIHAKFAALNATGNGEDGEGSPVLPVELPGDEIDDVLDEKPWRPRGSGIELGEDGAASCLHWMGGKVLEHAGFQGTSKVALDVLAGVTSEYLLNVGRTIRFLCDKYSNSMTPEEIILHTLFESGTARIQDLERYIKDDVVRYGARLGDLEKKLVGAYTEATAVEALDDDALFGEEEDDEDGAFVMGNFADAFGDDFLGLRELGIASEHGMSNLSIPKRLLKGKKKGDNNFASTTAKPTEPPLPFPLPQPFIPLDAFKVENQIGLLKPYYHSRLSALSTSASSAHSALPPPSAFGPDGLPTTGGTPAQPDPRQANLTLPDDVPNPAHVKMGPLGQIIKVGLTGASKKKAKAKESAALKADVAGAPSGTGAESPTKKKGPAPGTGSGSGKKKIAKVAEGLPPPVAASA